MKFWLAYLSVAILAGCFQDPESEALPYPPLRKEELVGCWKYVKPADACEVRCFDRASGYFYASASSYPGRQIAEDSGAFGLDQNLVNLRYQLRTTTGKDQSENGSLDYTIMNDSMYQILSRGQIGGAILARVSPDSFPCSLKPWTLFQKPADWGTLIIPY